MRRLLSLLLLAPLAACSSVKPEELDGFGLVMSAVRVQYPSDYEGIVITNVSGYCRKKQAYEDAYQEVLDITNDATESGDWDDYCGDVYEPWIAATDEARRLEYEGAHYLTIDIYKEEEFDDSDYDFGDFEAGLGVGYVTDDVWDAALEDFDEDGDVAEGCGLDDDSYADLWGAEDGSVEITAVEDEGTIVGSYEADLVEVNEDMSAGDDAGELTGKFRASWCDIEWAE